MLSNSQVAQAFWNGRRGKSANMTSDGTKLYSYSTVIVQRLPNGKTVGNLTKYSSSTSVHQSHARVKLCDYYVRNVPCGSTNLIRYLPQECCYP